MNKIKQLREEKAMTRESKSAEIKHSRRGAGQNQKFCPAPLLQRVTIIKQQNPLSYSYQGKMRPPGPSSLTLQLEVHLAHEIKQILTTNAKVARSKG